VGVLLGLGLPGEEGLSLDLLLGVSLEELELDLGGGEDPLVVLVHLRSPRVLKGLGGGGLVSLGINDVLVEAEVGHEVVDGVGILLGLRPPGEEGLSIEVGLDLEVLILGQVPVSVLILLSSEVVQGILDVLVHSEVGDAVVDGVLSLLGLLLGNVGELVAESVLGVGDVLLGVDDVLIDSEIGHEVVDGVVRLLGLLLGLVGKLVAEFVLVPLNVLLGIEDVGIDTEVGHEVVSRGLDLLELLA